MKRPVLTVVLNVHREGAWAYKAARSAIVALKRLIVNRPGDSVQIVCVADKADAATIECVREAMRARACDKIDCMLIEVDVGDLGLARNAGVVRAEGRFVAFLDGDDVWGSDWPLLAVNELERTCTNMGGELAVAHPCTNIDFGDGAFWWTQPDQRSDEFDPSTFWTTNCWSSGVMAPRDLLMNQPYLPRTEGLGFEDWEWNARTMAAGILHASIPGAVVFIRKKNDGMNADSAKKRQLVWHSEYFETAPRNLPRHKNVPMPAPVEGDWLMRQWRDINQIEPALWPDARRVQSLPRYYARGADIVPNFVSLITRKTNGKPTHLILAPCLVRGGADRRIVQYAAAVVRAGGNPLILTTDRAGDDSWIDALPDGVHVIDAAEVIKKAGEDTAVLAIARLVMMWRPVVHVINSRLGYEIIRRHGASLRDASAGPFYCSLYGSESVHGKKLGGAAFNGWFEAIAKYVDFVITDNGAHAGELRSILCWKKTFVIPSVVDVPPPQEVERMIAARRANKLPAIRVLWASRMVKGKRLDRLLAIAKLAHEKKFPIVFAVAGEPLDRFSKMALTALQALPNVKVSAKAFDNWESLSPERQDAFVFTSETEGMPNIVLEALARGLPVVSSNVGDVLQLPLDGVRVVHDGDDPEKWLYHISNHLNKCSPIHEWIRSNHSVESFDDGLRTMGYFERIKNGNRGDERSVGERESGPRSMDDQVDGALASPAQG